MQQAARLRVREILYDHGLYHLLFATLRVWGLTRPIELGRVLVLC